jgi:hypothetical protein
MLFDITPDDASITGNCVSLAEAVIGLNTESRNKATDKPAIDLIKLFFRALIM